MISSMAWTHQRHEALGVNEGVLLSIKETQRMVDVKACPGGLVHLIA
jgi:hypothetical protein